MSSGTVPSPALNLAGSVGVQIDTRFKPDRGRDEVFLLGHARINSQAVIDAGDLELRTIKSFVLTQYASRDRSGAQDTVTGSINTIGSLMNSVTITSLRGSVKGIGRAAGYPGTEHIGTIRAGTQQISFFALGA